MKKRRVIIWVFACLVFGNVAAWSVVYDLVEIDPLEVNFFDVGQGDAVFIETPEGHQVLIDGGPGNAVLEKLGQEMPFWDRTIDLVVLTHPEHDHIHGLLEVLKTYQVDSVLWTGLLRDTAEYQAWKKLLAQQEGEILIAKEGQRIITPHLVFYVLHPFESLEGKRISNSNNSSVVLHLVFKKNRFLFTGDAYKSVERRLVGKGWDLGSEVLKVGHHGSKTSTGREFVETVDPRIAVISVGRENRYDHPHQEVLDILGDYDINILRTDQKGDIKIVSDGEKIEIK